METTSSTNEIADIKQLLRPFWTVVLIGLGNLLAFVAVLAIAMDRNSIQSSERVLSSLLHERSLFLSDLVMEYGYWDDAVEHTVTTLNKEWINEYLGEEFYSGSKIEGVHLFDGKNATTVNFVFGVNRDSEYIDVYGPPLLSLISAARSTPQNMLPRPVVGLLGTKDALFLASAVQMTTYTSTADISTNHVLVFVRHINKKYLSTLQRLYSFRNLKLSQEKPRIWQAGIPALTSDNFHLGYFVWEPELPGMKMLPQIGVGFLVVLIVMAFSGRVFVKRVSLLVRSLSTARTQTERDKKLLEEARNSVRSEKIAKSKFVTKMPHQTRARNEPIESKQSHT